jgi:hypothetical protein
MQVFEWFDLKGSTSQDPSNRFFRFRKLEIVCSDLGTCSFFQENRYHVPHHSPDTSQGVPAVPVAGTPGTSPLFFT